ncbi:MAG: hypothetical protein OXI95_11455 [bacterium]|nr:hypothetical protein [bacterium]
MPGMKRVLATTASVWCLATPVAADDDLLPDASEALQGLLMLLEGIIESVPQYELPEVLENGDIIIRRIPAEPEEIPEEEETEPVEDI